MYFQSPSGFAVNGSLVRCYSLSSFSNCPGRPSCHCVHVQGYTFLRQCPDKRIKRRVAITRNDTWFRNRFESNQILLSNEGKRCSPKRRGISASILGMPCFLNFPYGIISHCQCRLLWDRRSLYCPVTFKRVTMVLRAPTGSAFKFSSIDTRTVCPFTCVL